MAPTPEGGDSVLFSQHSLPAHAPLPHLRRAASEHFYDTPENAASPDPLPSSSYKSDSNPNNNKINKNPNKNNPEDIPMLSHINTNDEYPPCTNETSLIPQASNETDDYIYPAEQPPLSTENAEIPADSPPPSETSRVHSKDESSTEPRCLSVPPHPVASPPSPLASSLNTTQDSSFDELGHHYDTPSLLMSRHLEASSPELPEHNIDIPATAGLSPLALGNRPIIQLTQADVSRSPESKGGNNRSLDHPVTNCVVVDPKGDRHGPVTSPPYDDPGAPSEEPPAGELRLRKRSTAEMMELLERLECSDQRSEESLRSDHQSALPTAR